MTRNVTAVTPMSRRLSRKSEVAAPHPDRLIRAWRAAIEAAARRADIAAAGPYLQDDTVHHRRVGTLKRLAHASHVHYRDVLQVLDLFDRATARGNVSDIQHHGERMVCCWEAAAVALARTLTF